MELRQKRRRHPRLRPPTPFQNVFSRRSRRRPINRITRRAMDEGNGRRPSLKRRFHSMMNRVLAPANDRQGRYVIEDGRLFRRVEREILDLLAFEQMASLMGGNADFEEIRERKALLRERIAELIKAREISLLDLRKADRQAREFCADVAAHYQLQIADEPHHKTSTASTRSRSLRKRLSRVISRISFD